MLPAQRAVNVIGQNSDSLSLGVHKKLGPEREVVQLVRLVIDVEEKRLFVGGAGQRRGVAAMRRVRGIERHDSRAERNSIKSEAVAI